jgi:hypothetical protein
MITLTQTGGFAGGISELGPVDTSSLDALVLACDFVALPEEVGVGRIMDGRRRTVTVHSDARTHRVGWTVGMSEVPDGLTELFRATEQAARDRGLAWRAMPG